MIPVASEKKPHPFKRVDIEIPLYQSGPLVMGVPKPQDGVKKQEPHRLGGIFGKAHRPLLSKVSLHNDRAEYDSEYNGQEEEEMLKAFCGIHNQPMSQKSSSHNQSASQDQSEN